MILSINDLFVNEKRNTKRTEKSAMIEDNNYYKRCIIKRDSLWNITSKLPLESLPWANARDVGSR